jgi:CubicO group peptidase (beta-lactamase class C family)
MYVGIPEGVEDRITTLEIWDTSSFGVPEDHPMWVSMPDNWWETINDMRVRKACIPSANGHFTANALAKMYGALANGGVIDGVRLMSSGRVDEMTREMSDEVDIVIGMRSRKGIGFFLGGPGQESYGPRLSAFGHGGAGGSIAFADPEVGLSIGVTLNKMVNAMSLEENRTFEICSLIQKELGVK